LIRPRDEEKKTENPEIPASNIEDPISRAQEEVLQESQAEHLAMSDVHTLSKDNSTNIEDISDSEEQGTIIKPNYRTSYTPAHEMALRYSTATPVSSPDSSPSSTPHFDPKEISANKPAEELHIDIEVDDSGLSTDSSVSPGDSGANGIEEDAVFDDVIKMRHGKGLVRKKTPFSRPSLSQNPIENFET
jgi:hypothetical protein